MAWKTPKIVEVPCRHGNQHVCERHPQVSGWRAHVLTQVDLSVTIPFPERQELCRIRVGLRDPPRDVESPGDGSCFASSSWAPRPAAAFRNGIAAVQVCRAARDEQPGASEHPGLDRVQRRRRALVPDQRLPRPAPAIDRDAAAASEGRRAAPQPDRGRDPDQWRGRCRRGPAVDARGLAVHDLCACARCWRS